MMLRYTFGDGQRVEISVPVLHGDGWDWTWTHYPSGLWRTWRGHGWRLDTPPAAMVDALDPARAICALTGTSSCVMEVKL